MCAHVCTFVHAYLHVSVLVVPHILVYRYEFSLTLNLDKFLKVADSSPVSYTLHAVLVHSGDCYGGHYVAYINPKGHSKVNKYSGDKI